MALNETPATQEATDATANSAQSQDAQAKTYTQEEFDRHMAGLKSSLAKKYEKQYADLGNIDELRSLKSQDEQRRVEEATKRGEFDRVIQELAAKKDAEISRRDSIIKEYKIDTPLLNSAARHRSVNPEQVKALLKNNIRLSPEGDVEVVDDHGQVRYSDQGTPVQVDDFVREWLDQNPHFVQSTPSTTNTRSNVLNGSSAKIDISKLDMANPQDREIYRQHRKTQGIR